MAHAGQEAVLGLTRLLQLQVLLLQAALELLALGYVSDRAADQNVPLGSQGAETDFHGKLAAVLMQSIEVDTSSHRPNLRFTEVTSAVADVLLAEAFGNQHLDSAAEQL